METKEKSESETIALILSLLSGKEMCILSQFLGDFEKEAGHNLPSFGHETVVDFLKSIPDKVQVVSVDQDLYLKLVEAERSADLGSDLAQGVENKLDKVDKVGDDPPVSAAVDTSSRDIPEEGKFEEESKTEMTNDERDANPPENVNVTPPCNTEEEDKCQNSAEEEPEEEETICSKCASLKDELEPGGFQCIDRCVSSVILDESDIPLINLRDHAKVSDCIEVSVPEVRNPHRFILQLRKFQTELTRLMGGMLTFYNLFSAKYALENFKFEKNQVCAALYKTNPECREWYRAKIINFGTRSSTVLLIDYGIVTDVTNTNIKYLDRDFGHLPVQALNGHLANVKPYRGKYWSEDCCKRLYNLVFEEDLVAQVIKMDTERRWLSVILSYADAEGFLINDNLVRGKFPVADCDFNEDESFSPVVYDSINPKTFIQPEDVGKTRRLKSGFGDPGDWKSSKNLHMDILAKK